MSKDSHETSLPPAVRKQVEEADKLIAEMSKAQEADPDDSPAEMPTEVPEAHAKEAQQIKQREPEPEAKREDWKQKYSVLKGKYDAEVPRMADDIRELKQMLQQSREESIKTHAKLEALSQRPAEKSQPAAPLVTAEEIDQFGPDLIDVVERVAKQAVAPYVDQKFNEVSSTVKQVNESVANSQKSMAELARERLYSALDNKVADWETINKEPAFLEWLKGEDGFSGQPRGATLRAAFERNDAERVVKFFKSFQAENAVGNDDPGSDAPVAETQQESRPNLDNLVAPGTPKTGSTDAQKESGKRVWTQKDIAGFTQWKNEFIRQRPNAELPEEMVAAERDLYKAQREGRIRP